MDEDSDYRMALQLQAQFEAEAAAEARRAREARAAYEDDVGLDAVPNRDPRTDAELAAALQAEEDAAHRREQALARDRMRGRQRGYSTRIERGGQLVIDGHQLFGEDDDDDDDDEEDDEEDSYDPYNDDDEGEDDEYNPFELGRIEAFLAMALNQRNPRGGYNPPGEPNRLGYARGSHLIINPDTFAAARGLPSGTRSLFGGGRGEPDIDHLSYEELMELSERIGPAASKGASDQVIASLPERVIPPTTTTTTTTTSSTSTSTSAPVEVIEAEEASSTSAFSSEEICAVCRDEFAPGDVLKTMPCFHSFHGACLEPWLKINATCPICKTDIPRR